MTSPSSEAVIAGMYAAFAEVPYPGDAFLQEGYAGLEPYDDVKPFIGQTPWQTLDPEFLDHNAEALHFFSVGALRYFLPAYLVADARGQFTYADPLFQLTYGFTDLPMTLEVSDFTLSRTTGKSSIINPRRFGALTAFDHQRYRLSVFTREEATAIVAYLHYRRAIDEDDLDRDDIDTALESFWLERTRTAPTAAQLAQHLADDAAYLDALRKAGRIPDVGDTQS